MPDAHDASDFDWVWQGAAPSFWPAFAAEPPRAAPPAIRLHGDDTLVVTLGSAAPAEVSIGRFMALLKDGSSVGSAYVTRPNGAVEVASFALLREHLIGRSYSGRSGAPGS